MGIWSWFQGLFSSSPSYTGTVIKNVKVTDVIDGDTLHVTFNGKNERLRLLCVDTEESQSGGSKPVTHAGKMASEMAKKYFASGNGWCEITIEFDTTDPTQHCLEYHRGTYGRLFCYVWKDGEHYNQKLIEEGWSPYFVKYGSSRLYDATFQKVHDQARKDKLVIWDPATNKGGPSRDYDALLPWWEARGARVKTFRKTGRPAGALDVREDYAKILDAMKQSNEATVFCDLQQGIQAYPGNGAVAYIGSKAHPLSLWIPDAESEDGKQIVNLIEKTYAKRGLGFAYITGKVTSYKDAPQIEITSPSQIQEGYPPS